MQRERANAYTLTKLPMQTSSWHANPIQYHKPLDNNVSRIITIQNKHFASNRHTIDQYIDLINRLVDLVVLIIFLFDFYVSLSIKSLFSFENRTRILKME